jgi:uncharacterized protein
VNRKTLIISLISGIIFGFILQKGGATKYDVIIGQLLFTDNTVLKIMLSAVVTGSFGIYLLKELKIVSLYPKPGSFGLNAAGGLIFGIGFALLGYCPGTIAGAVGNGYLDASIGGLAGIMAGSYIYALFYPKAFSTLANFGNYGAKTLPEVLKVNPWVIIFFVTSMIISLFMILEVSGL